MSDEWSGWIRNKPNVNEKKKKFGIDIKKAGERFKKMKDWANKNINPDIISGNEQRIFGIEDDFFKPKKKR